MMTPETIEIGQIFIWEHEHEGLMEVTVIENDRGCRRFLVADIVGDVWTVDYDRVRLLGRLEVALKAEWSKLDWLLAHCTVTYPEPFPVPVTSRQSLEYVMGLHKTKEIVAEDGLTGPCL